MTHCAPSLHRAEFPRSNTFDPVWVMENQMGPNPLWLAEWVCEIMGLAPGMKVLDLGCGTAMTSIFMGREYGVQVWAVDLWVHPDENWSRIRDAGMDDRVFPIRCEAHALPFAHGFFDAVISIDAYQYFGTDELYLAYLSRFVRAHGKIGIVVPGLMQPIERTVPAHLTRKQANGVPFWEDSCISFLTKDRWRGIWERSNQVDIVAADTLTDGWRYWRDFELLIEESGKNRFPSVAEALTADAGRYLGFIRMVGTRKTGPPSLNLYDPGIISILDQMDSPSS